LPLVDVLGVSPVDPKDIAVTPDPTETPVETHAVPLLVRTFPVVPGETRPVPPLVAGIANAMFPLVIVTLLSVKFPIVLTVFPS
jgi:hypothetical protein